VSQVYTLAIHPQAEREWAKLDEAVKKRFTSKLIKQRLSSPRVAKDALHGAPDLYKIKITAPQYRIAYICRRQAATTDDFGHQHPR
jgi:mRNA interferase RelE/StbE